MTANRTPPLALVAVAGVVTALLPPLPGQPPRHLLIYFIEHYVLVSGEVESFNRVLSTCLVDAAGAMRSSGPTVKNKGHRSMETVLQKLMMVHV